MNWYTVRSLYLFGVNDHDVNIFEERIVTFSAESFEEAHQKAEAEADTYAEECEFTVHDEQVAYKQDGSPLIDGYEVWSELFEADMSLDEFYTERYSKYTYHP